MLTMLPGYYHGLRVLVPPSQHVSEYPSLIHSFDPTTKPTTSRPIPPSTRIPLVEYNPYPMYDSLAYLSKHFPVQMCYLNSEKTIPAPSIYAYDGIPQFQAQPVFGSYEVLGINGETCFDRFGRLGPYNFEYDLMEGGARDNFLAPCEGNEAVCLQTSQISNWLIKQEGGGMNWTRVQNQCFDTNKQRFLGTKTSESDTTPLKTLPRTALVLRCWVGYEWHDPAILNLRALITELALNSGGEYIVHILLHLKDNQLPIWADPKIYRKVIEDSIPREFWDLTTIWTERYMETVYSRPFGETFGNNNAGSMHGAYRSLHMPLQWFAHNNPEYDFFWNWEMDIRYSGHYYELLDRLNIWSAAQPREGLWDRSAKYYIPALHGSWQDFSKLVGDETAGKDSISQNEFWPGYPPDFPGRKWLPDDNKFPPPGCLSVVDSTSTCGVTEPADLITFNPLFDPQDSGWVFQDDITGYDKSLPIPPRRTAIITASRLSKKLLTAMHDEMISFGHAAFSEMWPATVALHHGLKAVYAPHPVYFERKWPLEEVEKHFNGGKWGSSGESPESPFNIVNEHNHKGTTWYYNADFSGALWRRWLGYKKDGEGGKEFEDGGGGGGGGGKGTGRMCVRGMLLHPVKPEHEIVG